MSYENLHNEKVSCGNPQNEAKDIQKSLDKMWSCGNPQKIKDIRKSSDLKCEFQKS